MLSLSLLAWRLFGEEESVVIHPSTEHKFINDNIGFGVFATAYIPAGTIIYTKDALEILIEADSALLDIPAYRHIIEKYSYTEPNGVRVLSWDLGKYVNHSCDNNCLSTGYGFEIAIRDIHPGDQITDEYGVFNLERDFHCNCGSDQCRRLVGSGDFERYHKHWDNILKIVLRKVHEIPQPLFPYVDPAVLADLEVYLTTRKNYKSIYLLKYQDPYAQPRLKVR